MGSEIMNLEAVLKARVMAVHIAPVIDDLQDIFTINVEFTPMPGEKIGMYQSVYVGQEQRYRADRSPAAYKDFELAMIDEACNDLAQGLLNAEKLLAYLRGVAEEL